MLKVLELFGGIGACSSALDRLGVDYELVDYVEIDKYAVKSYNAIHGTNFQEQDVKEWNKNVDVDLIMHGSPCQDFSISGKQAGGDKGSDTRSSLMWETVRIVSRLKPKYVIWENVRNVLSSKHKHNFDSYIDSLKRLGYTSYYKIMNASDYGIPQHRERVFTVSVLGVETFEFPSGFMLEKRLKDFLDDAVDDRYYLSNKLLKYVCQSGTKGFYYKPEIDLDIAKPLTSTMHKTLCASCDNYVSDSFVKNGERVNIVNGEPKCTQIGQMYGTQREPNPHAGRVYDANGISPTVKTSSGGNTMPKVLVCGSINSSQDGVIVSADGVSPTHTAGHGNMPKILQSDMRIRKLTPKECWRLMGFTDEEFEKAKSVNSNTQLYKQAGNSIVVDILVYILKNLLS